MRHRTRSRLLAVAGLTVAIGTLQVSLRPSGVAAGEPAARTDDAVAWLERALATLEGSQRLDTLGPFSIAARGTLDKTAEGQGFAPGQPSPGPYREVLVFDPAGDRVARDYREERFDGTFEAFREVYLGPEERLYVVHEPPLVIPFRSPDFRHQRRELTRRLPHLLVAEMLEQAPQLRRLDTGDDSATILGALDDGTLIEVVIDRDAAVLRSAGYVARLPAKGAVEVIWWYDDYRPVEGLGLIPFRYGATVAGRPYIDMRVESVEPGGVEWLEPPQAYRRIPEQTPQSGEVKPPPPLRVEEVFPGVYRVPEVRSGFAPLIVAFDDFVVAVDAPASFPLLGTIPAGETDPASSFSWHSERLVDEIAAAFPERPLRYLVLTHAHEDHVGGVRAFVAAGATVLGPPATRPVVERLVALPPRMGDRLARIDAPELDFEAVIERRILADAGQRLEIVPVGDNPHAAGMLVVHLPLHRAVFVSDLVTPEPLEVYPRRSHAPLDRFFARWIASAGLDVEHVLAMHGAAWATTDHLEKARRSAPD